MAKIHKNEENEEMRFDKLYCVQGKFPLRKAEAYFYAQNIIFHSYSKCQNRDARKKSTFFLFSILYNSHF